MTKLSPKTRWLHWLIALTMIGMLALGIYMEETESFSLYGIHKSIGILIFVVVLYRVIWRIKEGWPTPVTEQQKLQTLLVKTMHFGLLVATILYPLSGMMMSGAGGYGLSVFGITLLPKNFNPELKEIEPYSAQLAELGGFLHGALTLFVIAMIVLHIAAALKHHFINKDDTLNRMKLR